MSAPPQVTLENGRKKVFWPNPRTSALKAWDIHVAIEKEFSGISLETLEVQADATGLTYIEPAPETDKEPNAHPP